MHRMNGPAPGRRRAALLVVVRTFLITAALVTVYYLIPLRERTTVETSVLLMVGVVAVGVVFTWEVWAIVRSPHPRLKAIEALVTTLALFLVLFASSYYVLDGVSPGSFNEPLTRTDALYFTLTTFATVGYGDVFAVSEPGRVMVMLQICCGLLLAGFAVRILTSAIERGLRRRREPPPGQGDGTPETPEGEPRP
ncbi:potassium channel family protein [Streptomyces sp. NPDC058964]|uniref:potassium channel family protein n=1 Tax=Streptomyces sp. NPDC058964 TaxID=3346681 RepID=UPI0036855633